MAKCSDEQRELVELRQGFTKGPHPVAHVHVAAMQDVRGVVEVVVGVRAVVGCYVIQKIGQRRRGDLEEVEDAAEAEAGIAEVATARGSS